MGHPFNSLLHGLTDRGKWIRKRDEAIQMARDTRATLTRPDGHWRYPDDDPRVAKAVQFWVDRARRAHAIALGRQPIIRNIVINNQQSQLFAREI